MSRRRGWRAGDWQVYRRLLQFSLPYLPRLAAGLLFGILYAAANGAFVWAIHKGLPMFFGAEAQRLSDTDLRRLMLALLAFPLIAAVRGIGDFGSKYLIKWVGNRVVMDIRNALQQRLLTLPIQFFSEHRTGELMARVTHDPAQVENAVSSVLGDIVKEPLTLAAMVGSVLWLDVRLALVSLVLFPLCIVPIVTFGRKIRKNARLAQERIADLSAILQETIVGARIVRAYGMEERERERFEVQNRTFFSKVMRMARARSAVEPLVVFMSGVAVSLVLAYAAHRGLAINQVMAFAAALVLLYEPVKKLSGIHLQIQQSVAAAERIFTLLDKPVSVADRPGAISFEGPLHTIEFDGVEFCYEGGQPVLRNFSLKVAAGTRVAIVGRSGSGKTTLVNLLPRFADPVRGCIRFNGRDIRDYTLKSLRRAIGVVTQETILFNDTVANNIRYGQPDAPISAVMDAARRANAHDFIAALPAGYDTPIGERGLRLSGGEKQRLAIARAVLRNPPLMILDEATSALDTASERLVQEALDQLMEGRTVFMVAHRLSTVQHCDRIVVLEQGRLVEEGRHEELLDAGGIYYQLYQMQFKEQAGSVGGRLGYNPESVGT